MMRIWGKISDIPSAWLYGLWIVSCVLWPIVLALTNSLVLEIGIVFYFDWFWIWPAMPLFGVSWRWIWVRSPHRKLLVLSSIALLMGVVGALHILPIFSWQLASLLGLLAPFIIAAVTLFFIFSCTRTSQIVAFDGPAEGPVHNDNGVQSLATVGLAVGWALWIASTPLVLPVVILGSSWLKGEIEPPIRYELPEGYRGWVTVRFGYTYCPSMEVRDGTMVIPIYPSGDIGRACMSLDRNHKVQSSIPSYVYVTPEGNRSPIPMTPSDPKVIGVRGRTRFLSYEQFFIGSEAEYTSAKSQNRNLDPCIEGEKEEKRFLCLLDERDIEHPSG